MYSPMSESENAYQKKHGLKKNLMSFSRSTTSAISL